MAVPGTKNNLLVRQHQSIHAHIRYLVSAVGKLDLQACPNIADSNALKNRIVLYRWALHDFEKVLRRDAGLDEQVFKDSPSLKGLLREKQEILEQINDAIILAQNVFNYKIMREELNVILVKINLVSNSICETLKSLNAREDELALKREYV